MKKMINWIKSLFSKTSNCAYKTSVYKDEVLRAELELSKTIHSCDASKANGIYIPYNIEGIFEEINMDEIDPYSLFFDKSRKYYKCVKNFQVLSHIKDGWLVLEERKWISPFIPEYNILFY